MAKGIGKSLARAQRRVQAEIRGNSHGKYGRGLAGEGYAGGYAQALSDVSAMLRGTPPGDPRGYWAEGVTFLDNVKERDDGEGS